MDKLRLIDAFRKSYFMINFIFCKNNGYSSSNTKSYNLCFQSFQIKLKSLLTNCHKKNPKFWTILLLKPEEQPQYRIIVLQ